MSTIDIQTNEITITESAANAVRDMLEKKELPNHMLRVFISGGGCSGYQYGMALEAESRPTDLVLEQFGVKILIDEASLEHMQGSVVDYVDDITGSGFKIDNPTAASSCGCDSGSSTDSHEHSDEGCGGNCSC